MSWGAGEYAGENSSDASFQTPAGHGGVTFVASSGDSGAPPSYPAVSPNVLAVGGTTLNLDSSGNILSESGWSGSGGGLSALEPQPTYQKGVVTQSSTARANPDVAYDADPNTGFPVYDSYTYGTSAPWEQVGGTSDAAPQWAGLIAVADQGRALAGLGSLDGPSQTLPDLYALPSTDFHDITTGSNNEYSAQPGYDLVTGLGTPLANLIVPALAGQSTTSGPTHFGVSAPAGSTAGASFTVTVTALNSDGSTDAGYTGTVHFTSSDSSAVLPADFTFTSTNQGVATFTVTLKSAGNQTVAVKDTSTSSLTGSASVTVTAAAASQLVFGQQPTNATVGAAIAPAVTVRELDPYGNLVGSDDTHQVTVAFGANPGGGALGGTTTVTVQGGVATFGNLSINAAGNGYTLTAGETGLTGATSASFNVVTSTTTVIESFDHGGTYNVVGGYPTASVSPVAAHDGPDGLIMSNGNDWIYRDDSAAQVQQGETISVWVKLAGSADGRAYFGFGATAGGTLSVALAPNTGQFIIQQNVNYGFTDLGDVNQTYKANTWYRVQVIWGVGGSITAQLYASDGATLLNTVTASTSAITSGGIAFRGLGHNKYFDTVTVTTGGGSPASPHAVLPSGASGGDLPAGPNDAAGALGSAAPPSFPTVVTLDGPISPLTLGALTGGANLPAATASDAPAAAVVVASFQAAVPTPRSSSVLPADGGGGSEESLPAAADQPADQAPTPAPDAVPESPPPAAPVDVPRATEPPDAVGDRVEDAAFAIDDAPGALAAFACDLRLAALGVVEPIADSGSPADAKPTARLAAAAALAVALGGAWKIALAETRGRRNPPRLAVRAD